MKSILNLKNIYYSDHLSQINLNDKTPEEIEKVEKKCLAVAEVRAFIDTIILQEYKSLSIFDLNGETKNGQKALEPREALRAKNLVCKYIWGYSWQDFMKMYASEDEIKDYTSSHSVLMRRLEHGTNVAIYGGANGPCGRTMIASIIMKEAIRLRLFTPGIVGQSYDWVDYQILIESLRDDSSEVPDYRTADWLVVDNIYAKKESDKQVTYRTNLLDPFFSYRFKNNLPTILVFQCDIRNGKVPLYQKFGTGISSIVNSLRICRIPLNKRN